MWLFIFRERRKAEERIYVFRRLKDRVLKWPGQCSELMPASQIFTWGSTGKKQKKNQYAVKELPHFSRRWPPPTTHSSEESQGSSPLATAPKVPETVLNPDGQLQLVCGNQTYCRIFLPEKCTWQWWQQTWSCSLAWGGPQTLSAHPPYFIETAGSVASQVF